VEGFDADLADLPVSDQLILMENADPDPVSETSTSTPGAVSPRICTVPRVSTATFRPPL
jgi:hypothetical protein